MKKIVLLVYLCLFTSIFSNDIEKDGFKGNIKSVMSTQYEMIPNSKNPTEYITNNENKRIVFIGEYSKEGKETRKYLHYDNIKSIYVNGYLEPYYNYCYYIGNHLSNLVNHFNMNFDFGFEFLKDNEKTYKVGIYNQKFQKISDIKIENTYNKDKLEEKIIYDMNGNFVKKMIFSYNSNKKSLTNTIIVKTYNEYGNLLQTEEFTYDNKNHLTIYKRDEFQKMTFSYDKNGNLIKFAVSDGMSVYLDIKYEYNSQNLLVSKNIVTSYGKGSLKYDYELDSKGNITKIKAYQSAEKFGKKVFEPIYIQVNNIEYY